MKNETRPNEEKRDKSNRIAPYFSRVTFPTFSPLRPISSTFSTTEAQLNGKVDNPTLLRFALLQTVDTSENMDNGVREL